MPFKRFRSGAIKRNQGGSASGKTRGKYSRPIFGRMRAGPLIRRAKRRNLVKLIKSVSLSKCETNYRTISNTTGALNDNTVNHILTLWDNVGNGIFPGQSVDDGSRIGDEIQAVGIMIRGQIEIPYDRRDTVCDIYFTQNNTAVGGPTGMFHSVTGNVLLDPVQSKRFVNVHKLGRYRVKATDAGMHSTGAWLADNVITKTILFKKWIPFKKTVKFVADNTATPTNIPELGSLVLACKDTLSTASTDNVVLSVKTTATLYFKDP
jgi:hypothetical protein